MKYYLGEEIILPNVPTYICAEEKDLQHMLANLDKLVVKAANESGGYGMLVGPHATEEQRAEFAREAEGQSAQLHRPADAGAVARADDHAATTSKAGTWTCDRTSCTARRSSSCPAA